MWGQGKIARQKDYNIGIIPTRVGTRMLMSQAEEAWQDHPHACGDKFACLYLFTVPIGSSPRVWGQDCSLISVVISLRIIPTRVGTSVTDFLFF